MSDFTELVPQFLAVTGCEDAERALNYLEMSGGSLETAVGLYLEHQGGGGSGGVSVGAGGGPSPGAGLMGDEVRAPDATQRMRLMDDGVMMGGQMNPYYNPLSAMLEESLQRSAFAAPPSARSAREAVNAAAAADTRRRRRVEDLTEEKDDMEVDDEEYDYDEDDHDDDDADDDGGGADGADQKSGQKTQSGLADMFAPPDHLIFKDGGFEGARNVAKDSKRWLLVNIQRDSEFSCHALNRDVWRDELVENLVREGFIFWQTMDTTREGRTYVQRYKVYDFPHLAIIDPRTRRMMWSKEGWTQENPMTAESFAQHAMDFCSRHSFDKPPTAPRSNGTGRPAKRPMHEMSEDEQLQAAMRASLQENKSGPDQDTSIVKDGDDDPGDDGVEFLGTTAASSAVTTADADSKPKATEPEPPKEPSLIEQLLAVPVGDEPAKGARVQFRMPDGKRIVRRFSSADTVQVIYAFAAQSSDEAKGGKEFELKAGFPPKDLLGNIDATIESCKLSGEAITMMWK